ncbi:hypothetical protein RUM43_004432, partial [Polyplax serrata]
MKPGLNLTGETIFLSSLATLKAFKTLLGIYLGISTNGNGTEERELLSNSKFLLDFSVGKFQTAKTIPSKRQGEPKKIFFPFVVEHFHLY